MKKIVMLFVCGLIVIATSCRQQDDSDQVAIVENNVSTQSSSAKASWQYQNFSWSLNTLSATSTGAIRCVSDYGTNFTAKRAVVTVSNNGSSAGIVDVIVQTTSSCINNTSSVVASFSVERNGSITRHILISGYTDPQLRIQIKGRTAASHSGLITYGYEY